MTVDGPSNKNEIRGYIHCGRCLAEFKEGNDPSIEDQSMATWARLSVGWTQLGIQVWCERHQSNLVQIDFEGHQHPANCDAS
jgi:hypothetical protein